MKWVFLACLLLIASGSLAAEPFARVAIEDDGNIVPGQQLRLDVTVFAPDFFTSPPQFPLFDLPNAVVTSPDERAQNVVETVDGIQYSGIRKVYAIVPEAAGSFSLPNIAIELGYSVDGKAVKGEARLPSFGFTVAAGGNPSGNTLTFAARNLTLTQSFDRDPLSLRAGDALVRTITVFAENTQAMMIPAVDVGYAVGMKQYASTSGVDDNVSVDRQLGSRRIQTVTYTIEAAGSFVIPDVSYVWYDIDERHQSKATLPSTKVTAVAVSLPAEGIVPTLQVDADGPPVWRKPALVAIALMFTAVAFGWLGWRVRHRLSIQSKRWMHTYRNSDRQLLLKLRKTILKGEPKNIEAGLRQWSREKGYRSLADWAADSAYLRNQIEVLQHFLYGGDVSHMRVDRKGLADAVSASTRRGALRRRPRSRLPALNPEG